MVLYFDETKEAIMSGLVPLVFWCATALFLICAYPISPPGTVKGLSSTVMANGLFLIATCCLVIHTFSMGKSCRGCAKRERTLKRAAYIWLCGIILFLYAAINDLVRRGGEYITMSLLVIYGVILLLLSAVFFILKYWQGSAGKKEP